MSVRSNSGFTLVEVIAVLVLIGIISAVVVPRLPKVGESEFAERLLLKSNLRYARQRSMDTTNKWTVSFSGNSYKLSNDGTWSSAFPSIDPDDNPSTHDAAVSFSGASEVEFTSPDGTPAGGTQTISFANSSVTVYSTGAIQ